MEGQNIRVEVRPEVLFPTLRTAVSSTAACKPPGGKAKPRGSGGDTPARGSGGDEHGHAREEGSGDSRGETVVEKIPPN